MPALLLCLKSVDCPPLCTALFAPVATRCCREDAVVAVTWGVFPNKEIMQPTVVDASSFKVWKDEAFALWTAGWASLYEANSVSQKVLGEIKSSYFLVSLLDNNYVDGDLFKVFP